MAIGTTFFEKIQGKSGNVEYRTRMNKKIEVAARRKPTDKKTEQQNLNRARYIRLSKAWTDYAIADTELYDIAGKILKISSWNMWVLRHMNFMNLDLAMSVGCSEGKGTKVYNIQDIANEGTVQAEAWNTTRESKIPVIDLSLGDYWVEFPYDPILNLWDNKDATWVIWYKYKNDVAINNAIFENMGYRLGELVGYHMFMRSTGKTRFMIHALDAGSPVFFGVTSKIFTRDGAWHCQVVRYLASSQTLSMFTDGVQETQTATKVWDDANNAESLRIGKSLTAASGDPIVGEYGYAYDRFLSVAEVSDHYEKTKELFR